MICQQLFLKSVKIFCILKFIEFILSLSIPQILECWMETPNYPT